MKKKNDEGECAPSKVSQEIADKRKAQAASLFETESSNGNRCDDGAELRMKVKRVCIAVRNAYQVPETYSIDDLYQDVMFRFWKALRRYRGEASLTTVIHRIAVNQLIDQGRKEGWCKNPSRSKTENRGGDTHVEEDFVTKPRRGHREIGQYDGAERELQTIFVHELQETWTDTDHFVWDRYLAGEKLADTAAILAITPQAVSNRRKRLINKTRKLVEAGTTTTALTQTRATA